MKNLLLLTILALCSVCVFGQKTISNYPGSVENVSVWQLTTEAAIRVNKSQFFTSLAFETDDGRVCWYDPEGNRTGADNCNIGSLLPPCVNDTVCKIDTSGNCASSGDYAKFFIKPVDENYCPDKFPAPAKYPAKLAEGCNSLKTPELQQTCWREKADIPGADLQGAYLVLANFNRADLRLRNLSGAELNKAILTGTDLREADLTGADLSGADLSGTWVTEEEIAKEGFKSIEDWDKYSEHDPRYIGPIIPTDLRGAKLGGAILTGATVSRRRTLGIDFDDWKKRGGIVGN